jgi:hypothetical protein
MLNYRIITARAFVFLEVCEHAKFRLNPSIGCQLVLDKIDHPCNNTICDISSIDGATVIIALYRILCQFEFTTNNIVAQYFIILHSRYM